MNYIFDDILETVAKLFWETFVVEMVNDIV